MTPPLQKSITDCRAPHPALQPFIEHYIYRRIQVPADCSLEKLMPLRPASSLDFFLGSPFETIDQQTEESIPFTRNIIRGPRTNILYSLRLKGEFISFTILFKATGLYKLFGIAMDSLADRSLDNDLTKDFPLCRATGRLMDAPEITSCIRIVEPYLLLLAERSRDVPHVIEKAVNLLEHYPHSYSIKNLARESFLSLRQLERSFSKYIGISPKTYFRLHRFLKLLAAKQNSPQQKWGSLAHEFGYYDQMHFLKEFKYFFKSTPSNFDLKEFSF